MTRPTRQVVERDLRAFLAGEVERDKADAQGLPAASKAKWLLTHLDVFTKRPARRRRKEGRC